MAAYRETVDWMYADPKASNSTPRRSTGRRDIVRDTIREFYPKEALQTERMADMPGILRDAVKLKYLARTAERRPAQGADPHAAAVGLRPGTGTQKGAGMRDAAPRGTRISLSPSFFTMGRGSG